MSKQHYNLLEQEELRLEQHFHVHHVHKYVMGYLFTLLLVIVVAGVYSWQHTEVVRLEREAQALTSQLEEVYR